MIPNIDNILKLLSECPPGPRAQIDDNITPKIAELIGKSLQEQANGIQIILDQCAYSALATDFGMMALDRTLELIKDELYKSTST